GGVHQELRQEGRRDTNDIPSLAPCGSGFGANPSFVDLLRFARAEAPPPALAVGVASNELPIPHGTTVLGLKYAGGVIMAGDRRATAGDSSADAKMRKVVPAGHSPAI